MTDPSEAPSWEAVYGPPDGTGDEVKDPWIRDITASDFGDDTEVDL